MRSWGTRSRGALGATKRPLEPQAQGPSRVIRDVWQDFPNPANGPWRLSMDARTLLAKRVPGNLSTPGYRCFTNLGGCAADPGSLAKSVADNELVSALIPWERNPGETYEAVRDYEKSDRPNLETAGLYFHDSDPTNAPVCWTRLWARDLSTGSFSIWSWFPRLPYDVMSPRIALQFRNRYRDVDLTSGAPGCASGWLGGTPPSSILWTNSGAAALAKHYEVWTRVDEDAPWVKSHGPWETGWGTFPSGSFDPGVTIQETTGYIWARKLGTSASWEVWPATTAYAAASRVTVTIPAGNIDWWVHWGHVTIARSTAGGTIYVWHDTTSLGAVPAPFSASAWWWAHMAYGWLVITEQAARRVLWYRVNQDGTGLQHVFTQDTWPGAGAEFTPVQVEACGEHDAISGTYTRYIFDPRRGRWEHGGEIPHVRRLYEEEGWWWYATRYRHLVMAESTGTFPSLIDKYHLVQVT
jgi:hypothetical protein